MKILVVDDHPLILHALSQVLPDLDGDLEILGAANRAEPTAPLGRQVRGIVEVGTRLLLRIDQDLFPPCLSPVGSGPCPPTTWPPMKWTSEASTHTRWRSLEDRQ